VGISSDNGGNMLGDKKAMTIALLKRGWLTAMECAQSGGVWSLSQRVSELRASGDIVIDKWIELPSGSKIKAYKLLLPTKWTA
jgi:hypothetical protein